MSLLTAFSNLLLWPLFQSATNEDTTSTVNYDLGVPAPVWKYGKDVYAETLVEHTFTSSSHSSLKVDYTPPSTEFNQVILTLDVDTTGVYYERLAHIKVNGVELWRINGYPLEDSDSKFSQSKDVTLYLPLFRSDSTIEIDLGELGGEGELSLRLNAQFFNHPPAMVGPKRIVPIFSIKNGTRFETKLPQLHRNTTRASIELYATEDFSDEQWYALHSSKEQDGPLRHLQVYVNDEVAGAANPFYQVRYDSYPLPNVFSPLLAPKTLDSPSYRFDIGSFLPDLWESEGTAAIDVLNSASQLVSGGWIISGSLFIWEDEESFGTGVRYPTTEFNETKSIRLFGIESWSFNQFVNATADLEFNNRTKRIETVYDRIVHAGLVGPRVVTHKSKDILTALHGTNTFFVKKVYDIDHVVTRDPTDPSNAVSVEYKLYESDTELDRKLWDRKYNIYFNGTWDSGNDSSDKNGSETKVFYREGDYHFKKHAYSEDGKVVRSDI